MSCKVIVMAQIKGGSTKSTTALVLAQVLARQGKKVLLVDCDPNKTLLNWHEGTNQNITVQGGVSEQNIVRTIADARKQYDYVFVDLEGTANLLVSRAILKADFVLIPMQPSMPDAVQANRVIQLIQAEEEAFERPIPHAFIFTRTSPIIRSKIEQAIEQEIRNAGYALFTNQLNERAAFKGIFFHRSFMDELEGDQTKAIENAKQVCQELVERMK
ncbi:chromosome partitioning protein [Gluconobacter cerinus]|uniref:ParA family protein n=1 Tax=Gluconobacter cerinus TaxID=38307 RepID=UPI001B8D61F5|nr:ParA family protein [Gluconobacter cerinus]MBS0984334.1 ParA family protein [Gluconobacter cerinus]MCW2267237.1 chromosome partitioning protein [Gluconobacter cerinus]